MKLIINSLSLFIILGHFILSAADISIDLQIQNIKNAPAEKRVILMNKLKLQMVQMNQKDRASAISKLQEKMQSHQNNNPTSKNQWIHQDIDKYNHSNDVNFNQTNQQIQNK
ncbi:MAG: hypothetical protein COB17_08890 [Sulfurimonas sp.]|nr:MAG: hypothetical protein COB17_08890 [Sulfurimonas sp.]